MNIKIKFAENSFWAVIFSIVLIVFIFVNFSLNKNQSTDNQYLSAESLFNNSDLYKAKLAYESIIQKDPKDLLSYIRISEILTKEKRYDSAIAYLKDISPKFKNNDNDIIKKLGQNYYLKQDYVKSEEYFKLALNDNSNSQELIGLLTNQYLVQGKYSDSLTFLNNYKDDDLNDVNLFSKRLIQIFNGIDLNTSTTNFIDKSLQTLFLKIETNLPDYKDPTKKIFGATNIAFELLQYNYFELAKPFSEDIINANKYMDHGYFYKGMCLLNIGQFKEARELFNQAYLIDTKDINNNTMLLLSDIVNENTEKVSTDLVQIEKIYIPSDKYKLFELMKFANDKQKNTLALEVINKFNDQFNDDIFGLYFRVKFNALNNSYNDLLGDINKLFAESHYLNYKQKALLTGIKGFIIAKNTNIYAGKELINQCIEFDDVSPYCYYFLAKINMLQNDKLSYDINIEKAKSFDLFNELKYD